MLDSAEHVTEEYAMMNVAIGARDCNLQVSPEARERQGGLLALFPTLCFLPTTTSSIHQPTIPTHQWPARGKKVRDTPLSDNVATVPCSRIKPYPARASLRDWAISTRGMRGARRMESQDGPRRLGDFRSTGRLHCVSQGAHGPRGSHRRQGRRSGAQDRPSYCPIFAPANACSGPER